MPASVVERTQDWLLEGFLGSSNRVVQVPIHVMPFRIGRAADQDMVLRVNEVSGNHAILTYDGKHLWLQDAGSTNGTFVNRHRIKEAVALSDGDVLHFGTAEFRLVHQPIAAFEEPTITRTFQPGQLSQRYYPNAAAFRQMLNDRHLKVQYQPIVDLRGNPATPPNFAYEALGRADQPGIPQLPGELFKIAASLDCAAELSRVLRELAVEGANALPGDPAVLFVNTHPDETVTPTLLESIAHIQSKALGVQLVLEVHERAITDIRRMRELAAALRDYGVALAYDDFGAGQARLLELVEATPAYVKFDRSMVHALDRALPQKRTLVKTLVRMVLDFGIIPLAEGVETAGEAAICVDIGFQLGQGWVWGRPRDISEFG
ncbi:MAG: EAL domain-containing protein [Oligoflexia bacterium]|nr:EAL domain-containing protein [Oligoflexia bacterium]